MKKLLYILLALPLLTACREKKETAGAAAMYQILFPYKF